MLDLGSFFRRKYYEKCEKTCCDGNAVCSWNCTAVYDWADTGYRKDAFADAYSCIVMRLYSRLADQYGAVIGFLLPIVRGILFGMPPLYPNAVAMAFEMATYGFVSGFLYSHAKWQCTKMLYVSLIAAMLAGRVVWAFAEVVLLGIGGNMFTWNMFVAGAFLNAIPGIIVQLVLIPLIMIALKRAKVVPLWIGNGNKSGVSWRAVEK